MVVKAFVGGKSFQKGVFFSLNLAADRFIFLEGAIRDGI